MMAGFLRVKTGRLPRCFIDSPVPVQSPDTIGENGRPDGQCDGCGNHGPHAALQKIVSLGVGRFKVEKGNSR